MREANPLDAVGFYVGQKVNDHLGRQAVVFKVDQTRGALSIVVSIRHENGMEVHYVGSKESISKEIKPISDPNPN